MKTTWEISPEDLNLAVKSWLKTSHGVVIPDEIDFSVLISKTGDIEIPKTGDQNLKLAAIIGQTIDGTKITHYGYAGDSSPDSNSMRGIGDRGNTLQAGKSAALTQSERHLRFNVNGASTGKAFTIGGVELQDDDSAPESDRRVDVYDPFYTGRDVGCTDEMYAKSKAQMVQAGILPA